MPLTAKDRKLVFDYLHAASEDGFKFKAMLQSLGALESTEEDLYELWEELKDTEVIRLLDPMNPDWFTLTTKGIQVTERKDSEP